MNIKKFKLVITDRQRSLLKENKELLSKGKMNEYHNNCFQLKGISFVMQKLMEVNF